MQSKSLLIAIAAFAVTATGVQAYTGPKLLTRAGLNDKQVSAIEAAHDFQAAGDFMAARNTLVEAGITEETLFRIHKLAKASKETIHSALDAGDYHSFLSVVVDTPLEDLIVTESDFKRFQKAHELKKTGNWLEAKLILTDLGLESKPGQGTYRRQHQHPAWTLDDEQRDAFRAARQANDKATMQAILDEAGIVARSLWER